MLKINVFRMNSFFASAPLSQCNRFPYTCFQLSLQTLPLEMLIFPWLCPGARGPPPTLPSALGIHLSLPLVPIKCNTHGVATQPPRRLVGTADTHCACAEIGYPQRSQTSEELPRSFRPGLGSPELPGSQERLAGKSPRARGFLGQVVAALARLDFEQALDSPGLHVPHSQPCAPVGALSSGGPPGRVGRVASCSHKAERAVAAAGSCSSRCASCVRRGGGRSCRRPGRAGS